MKKSTLQKNKIWSTAAAITLLLCFCLCTVGFFCIGTAVGVVKISASGAFTGAAGLLSVSINGATLTGGELAVLILVGIFGCAAFAALILFLLIFPIVNKLFHTHLPCYAMFDRLYEDEPDEGSKKNAAKPARPKTKEERQAEKTREKNRKRALATKHKNARQREAAAVAGGEGYADDRYVKTVRIDTLYNPKKETVISASKIDQAMRVTTEYTQSKTRAAATPTAAVKNAPQNTARKTAERDKFLEKKAKSGGTDISRALEKIVEKKATPKKNAPKAPAKTAAASAAQTKNHTGKAEQKHVPVKKTEEGKADAKNR